MKTIYIKYNPYKVETEIKVDDELVKENSQLNVKGKRLQEWVEDLPRILVEECKDNEYKIIFYGTALDFDDIQEVIEEAKVKEEFEGIVFEYEYQKGQEVEDKESKIKKIFEEIQQGSFEELKGKDVEKVFEQAQNQELQVSVIATISAGKSTLINALLGKKLMPSSQEACTATISEIQDNDKEIFEAQAFDKDGNLYVTSNNLDLETMKEWNSNEKISKIEIKGDIPFVNADDTRLILMDTPGPNNSRNKAHQETTMRSLSESSKTLVLYILNATQAGVNDDNNLLNMVAENMKVGGKQSKDRFIFVVNKLDDFKRGEDDVKSTLNKVCKYLEDKGIENPNIYPVSALIALNIRTILKDEKIDDLNELDTEFLMEVVRIKKIIDSEQLHLEQYTLNSSNSLKKKIENQLENAQNIYENEDKSEGIKQLGLIHSGIIPIEEALKLYVEKYAKTNKIRDLVNILKEKIEEEKNILKKNIEISEKNKIDNIEAVKKYERQIRFIKFDLEKIKTKIIVFREDVEVILYRINQGKLRIEKKEKRRCNNQEELKKGEEKLKIKNNILDKINKIYELNLDFREIEKIARLKYELMSDSNRELNEKEGRYYCEKKLNLMKEIIKDKRRILENLVVVQMNNYIRQVEILDSMLLTDKNVINLKNLFIKIKDIEEQYKDVLYNLMIRLKNIDVSNVLSRVKPKLKRKADPRRWLLPNPNIYKRIEYYYESKDIDNIILELGRDISDRIINETYNIYSEVSKYKEDKMQSILQLVNNDIKNIIEKIDNLKNNNMRFMEDIQNLKSNIERLEIKKADIDKKISELNSQKEEMENKYKVLKNEGINLIDKSFKLEAECNNLNEKMSLLNEFYKKIDNIIEI
ncbi:dynamin family protein [Megamonas hypermegale]|uniref:dynamin family protein n=1 Tax=Megamonas hypermegale TaxID=158847 RepID=UPI00195A10AE|nr:dynamin family protein [Megamonas hypermegale]MBM6760690.1 dynamin family protein [Megamonas hypermegale]